MLTALRSQNQPLQLELVRLDTPQFPGKPLWTGGEAKRDTGMVPNALTWHQICSHQVHLLVQGPDVRETAEASHGSSSPCFPWLGRARWGKSGTKGMVGLSLILMQRTAGLEDLDGSKGVILFLDSLNWVLPGRFLEHSHEKRVWSGFSPTLQTPAEIHIRVQVFLMR